GALAPPLGAIADGLLSSTFHLGQPRRAWRAFSQWRTSWLSREGVASVATYAPALLLAVTWVFLGIAPLVLGLLATIGAVCTVYCTAMIYRSLKPVPRWDNGWVVPHYFALALMTGVLWRGVLAGLAGRGVGPGPAGAELGGDRGDRGRGRAEARLLAFHRQRPRHQHAGNRDGTGLDRHRAPVRGTPHVEQLSPQGDGLRHR